MRMRMMIEFIFNLLLSIKNAENGAVSTGCSKTSL